MGYYDKAKESRTLAHHGILGQKWGVRRFQNYDGTRIVQGKSYKYAKSKWFHDQEVNFALNDSNNVEEVEKRYYSNGNYDYFSPARVIRDFEAENKNVYKLQYYEDFNTAALKVNPDYGECGTTNNCTRVSAAMELRNRGYDVIAARSHRGASAFEYETWFKDAKTKGYDSFEDMKKDLLRNGDGASGSVNGYFGDGLGSGQGGHALHWSVNGRHLEVQDGQNGKTFSSIDDAWDYYGFNKNASFATRLDNCEPNWDAMIEDSVFGVNNRGRKWRQNGNIYDNF